jgi:hypothetical protein
LNIVYGRDYGDEWEHFTINVSPAIEGETTDWVHASDVESALDPDTSEPVYRRQHA